MRRALALAVAFAVASTGVAGAQRPGAHLPDRAEPVAGPTASGARLFIWDEGRYLCGSVVRPRARGFGSTCEHPPETLRGPQIASDEFGSGPNHVWGIVEPEVASVEVVFAHGRRVSAHTTSGDRYRGRRAGRFRFFLIETRWPRTDFPLYVRLLGAGGEPLAAVSADPYDGGRAQPESLVGQGRLGKARWFLRAFTRPSHAPVPGDEERVVTQRCLELEIRGPGNSPQGGGPSCDEPDYPAFPLFDVQRTCGPVGVQAAGMVHRGVRVEAVLGDGRRVRPPLLRLPRRFGAVRAFVLVLAPEVALRSLATVEKGRRHVEIAGIGPGIVDCPDASSGWYFGFPLEMPRFGPEPAALQLRDGGALLCATLGLPHPEGYDCGRPPLDADSSWLLTRVTEQLTTVAGVVSPDVGSVEVVFADGERHVVPTTEDTYPGRYRGLIRSFSLAIPGEHEPRGARLNGLDGRQLASRPLYDWPEFVEAPRTVLRTRSGWKLAAAVAGGGALRERRFACFQLTRGAPSADVLACDGFGSSKQARVTCNPRRTLVYGQVGPRVQRVEVHSTHGVTEPRPVSLRPLGISGRAFLVELPGTAALRRVVIHGKRVRRLRLRLPPASSQCGYGESVSFR